MADRRKDGYFYKMWLWLTIWLSYFINFFSKSYGFSSHESFNLTIDNTNYNRASTLNENLSTDEQKKTNFIDTSLSYLTSSPELQSLDRQISNQHIKNLTLLWLDQINEGTFSDLFLDEILKQLGNECTDTQDNFVLLKIYDLLTDIEPFEKLSGSINSFESEEDLFETLTSLEKDLDSSSETEFETIFIDDTQIDDTSYYFISFQNFKRKYLLEQIDTAIYKLENAEKILCRLDENYNDLFQRLFNLLNTCEESEKSLNLRIKNILNNSNSGQMLTF